MLKTDAANNSMVRLSERVKGRDLLPIFVIATAILLLHVLTNMR